MASFDRRARPVAPFGVRPVDGLGRRRFLTLAGLLASFGQRVGLAQPVAATFGLPEFLDLSRRLTGRPALDRQTAKTYLAAFLATSGNQARLLELLQRGSAISESQRELERTILAAWYTGVYQHDGRPALATHSGALMWQVLGTPAPGTCAGETGFWSRPPGPTRD